MTTTRTRSRSFSSRYQAAALAAATAVGALTLAACNSGSTGPAHAATSSACQPAMSARCSSPKATAPAPAVITPQSALAVLTHYTTTNNLANKERSDTINDSIETGTLRAKSQAEYKTYPLWSAKEKKSLDPFTYTSPRFYIPRHIAAGQQPWFAVVAHGSWTKTDWSVMVFTKTGTVWKMSAATQLEPGQGAPNVAVDDQGFATALDPDTTGLAMRPSALSLATNDNYATGGVNTGQIFGPSRATNDQRKEHQDTIKHLRPEGRSDFAAANNPFPDVYALQLTGGGALVVASSVHAQHDYMVTPGWSIDLRGDVWARAWVHSNQVYNLTTTFSCLDAAIIPKAGKATLLGYTCEVTNAQ